MGTGIQRFTKTNINSDSQETINVSWGDTENIFGGFVLNVSTGLQVSAFVGGQIAIGAAIKLTLNTGPAITWNPLKNLGKFLALDMKMSGLHWHAAVEEAWYKKINEENKTIVKNYELTVGEGVKFKIDGEKSDGSWSATNNMTLSAKKKFSCSGEEVAVKATTKCSIDGATMRITGETNTAVAGADSLLILKSNEAALENGTGGGIKATAAETVISGPKVMIGIPGSPPAPVATETQISHLNERVNWRTVEIYKLGVRLTELQDSLNGFRLC